MITAKNISKHYGKVTALDSVSFSIEAGETLALWGANGAGKTTVMRCLLGVHSFKGSLTVDSIDVQKNGKAARKKIGYVPQEIAFFDMTVYDTLRFYARLKKVKEIEISSALEMVQLVGHDDKAVSALSGGMKQRLALAIALLADPPILLLDEPTASLDAHAQREFVHMLRTLNQAGKTIIFSSHRFEEVVALAKRVLVLEGGKLITLCTPEELATELGLRQWLRVVIADTHLKNAYQLLQTQGYQHIPNGTAFYVNIETTSKMDILRLFENVEIPIIDFDVMDAYALPHGGTS